MKRTLMWIALTGCPPVVADSDTDGGSTGGGPEMTALVATVAGDYSVGTLATLGAVSFELQDEIAPISTDPGIAIEDGYVFLLAKFGFDAIRVYEPGAFSVPLLEFSVGDGANPQDVELCRDKLFVANYGLPEMTVYNLDGDLLGSVSMAEYADADGIPEMGSLAEIDGRLFVGLNRLDETTSPWQAAGPGQVVEVDCESLEVVGAHEVGPNATIHPHPTDPSRLIVQSGVYYDSEYSLLLDGGLASFDPSTGELAELVSEAALGENVSGFAATEDGGVVLTQAADSSFTIWCLDPADFSMSAIETTTSFLIEAEIDPYGKAWVAARPSWADADAVGGVVVVDVGTCDPVAETEWITTSLPPYAIGFY